MSLEDIEKKIDHVLIQLLSLSHGPSLKKFQEWHSDCIKAEQETNKPESNNPLLRKKIELALQLLEQIKTNIKM